MASQLPISKPRVGSAQLGVLAPNCKVILAQSIAKSLLSEVQENLRKLGRSPLLVGFLANSDPAARMYADWTAKTCKEKCKSPFLMSMNHLKYGVWSTNVKTQLVGSSFN